MKKIADFIVEKRTIILIAVLLLAGVCGFLIPKVGINTDMTKYLPDSSSMKIGMDIMDEEFPDADPDYTIRVMFRGLTTQQKTAMQEKLAGISNVTDVDYKPDDEDYNRGEYTKYLLHTEYDYGTAEELAIEQALESGFPGLQHPLSCADDCSVYSDGFHDRLRHPVQQLLPGMPQDCAASGSTANGVPRLDSYHSDLRSHYRDRDGNSRTVLRRTDGGADLPDDFNRCNKRHSADCFHSARHSCLP